MDSLSKAIWLVDLIIGIQIFWQTDSWKNGWKYISVAIIFLGTIILIFN